MFPSPAKLSQRCNDWLAGAGPELGGARARVPPLNIAHERRRAAIAGPFAGARRVRHASRALRCLLAAVAAGWLVASPASLAATSGDRGAPLPTDKLVRDALTYSGFQGGCSQTAFLVSAVGSLQVTGGPVAGPGSTTLDGVPFDTYLLDLKTGPATFQTTFDRTFSPALPSSTYEMVFTTHVVLGGVEQGVSMTTIQCKAGVMSAWNQAIPATPRLIPVGGLPAWLALTMLLAAAAASRLRTRRG